MGGRLFVKGLYQALFSFRLARRNVNFQSETKIEPDLRLPFTRVSNCKALTGTVMVFWIGGRFLGCGRSREVVAHGVLTVV